MTHKTMIACFLLLAGLGRAPGAAPAAGQAAAAKWSTAFADYTIKRWPDAEAISGKKWEYNNSIVLHGIEKVYLRSGDVKYRDYIQHWVDQYIDATGRVDLDRENENLDLIHPGVLALFLYQETQAEKYHLAGRELSAVLYNYPRNRLGGFWHKEKYPDEMWADGIYMAQPFAVKFSALFDEDTGNFGQAYDQITMCAAKNHDPNTGLLFHGWDADKNAAWAAPQTGLSPHVWSRGMGWFSMALVDVLEYFPTDHPGRAKLIHILENTVSGLQQTQDSETGLWFQVMEDPRRAGNWPELSGSLMFVYSIKKGLRLGLLKDGAAEQVAQQGWDAAQKHLSRDEQGDPQISDVVQGMGVQKDFEAYVTKERLVNSTHGLCAIMFAASEMEF